VGKPGNYSFQKFNDPAVFDFVCEAFESVYRQAESSYYEMIEAGIAKEIARSVLPVGQYTEFIWTVNLRSLLNFLSLRNDSNAQHEIREYAKVIERIANTIVPVCMDSFVENGRMAL
jgi:thymidylate synthase (FAD)